jgi:hypothetical protein
MWGARVTSGVVLCRGTSADRRDGAQVSQPTADRLPQAWLAAAMGRLPDGVAVFDGD